MPWEYVKLCYNVTEMINKKCMWMIHYNEMYMLWFLMLKCAERNIQDVKMWNITFSAMVKKYVVCYNNRTTSRDYDGGIGM